MTIGFNEWRLSDDWSGDELHRDCLLPEVSSQRTPGRCWEQLSADLIEISQRKHGLRPCQVLGQAAVSHFGEAPQLLDYAKGVFAARPGPRTRPVDHPPARAQRPFRGRTPIDPVAHPPGLEKLSIVFLPVRLIAEDFPLLPVQQVRQLGDVGYAGSGRSDRMDDTAFTAPMCSFIPKCQLRPLRVCFIWGARLALPFLVDLGAAMMVASTMVPERSSSRRSSKRSATASKMAWVSPCCSSRWRKRRIVLSSGTTSSPSSTRAKRRIDSLS